MVLGRAFHLTSHNVKPGTLEMTDGPNLHDIHLHTAPRLGLVRLATLISFH